VKVKGAIRPDGRFVAEKVALKKAEELAVIDGVIQMVETAESQIALLNTTITLTDSVEIWSPEQRQLDVDQLREGQAIELLGEYSSNPDSCHQDPGAARFGSRARRDSGESPIGVAGRRHVHGTGRHGRHRPSDAT
jgi:hypothetical protein